MNYLRNVFLFAFVVFFATLAPFSLLAQSDAPLEISHGLSQTNIGYYKVLLPPGYHSAPDKEYKLIVILHGSGSSMDMHGALANKFGRGNAIYVVPNAPHLHTAAFSEKREAYSSKPKIFPENLPKYERKKLEAIAEQQSLDWITKVIADARQMYRVSTDRAILIGHSQGATFAHRYAMTNPEAVSHYVAYAGYFDGYDSAEALEVLKRADTYPLIIHHLDDPVNSVSASTHLMSALYDAGVPHGTWIEGEGGHGVTPDVIEKCQWALESWL